MRALLAVAWMVSAQLACSTPGAAPAVSPPAAASRPVERAAPAARSTADVDVDQEAEPDEVHTLLLRAEAALDDGSHDTARQLLEQAHTLDPARTDVLLRIGNVELYRGNPESALIAFETAFHLGDAAPRLPVSIAELWVEVGDVEAALTWFSRAHERNPSDTALRLRHAQVLLTRGATSEAKALAEPLRAHPNREIARSALALLGYAAKAEDDEQGAAQHWEAATEAGLDAPAILAFLAQRHYRAARYSAAAERFGACLAVAPSEAIHRQLILSLALGGQVGRARESLAQYLATYTDSPHRDALVDRVSRAGAGDETASRD